MTTCESKFIKMNSENFEAYTPRYAVDVIAKYLPKDKVIWAPFSLDSHNFANYLRGLGFNVRNTHFDPATNVGDDFLTYTPDFHFDLIVDNPPFKGKTKYVERAISFGKPFALFLPAGCIGDNGIPGLFIEHGIDLQMLIPDKRTVFENQPKEGISFKTIFICRDVLPKQIVFSKLIIPAKETP
jgi:hypothetical protein